MRQMTTERFVEQAERTYNACQRNADRLERLLGERDYVLLLYKVARS